MNRFAGTVVTAQAVDPQKGPITIGVFVPDGQPDFQLHLLTYSEDAQINPNNPQRWIDLSGYIGQRIQFDYEAVSDNQFAWSTTNITSP